MYRPAPGRSPRGGRGLKSSIGIVTLSVERSPSSRRAWIEIKVKRRKDAKIYVALLAEGVD